jgi:hypothetical protein
MSEHLFYGGEVGPNGTFIEHPLPHIADGFTLVLNSSNWVVRDLIIRRIFETVSPSFQPLIPSIDSSPTGDSSYKEFIKELHDLFENHGMEQVKVRVEFED